MFSSGDSSINAVLLACAREGRSERHFVEADIAGQSIDFFTIEPEPDFIYVINEFFLGSADVYSGMFPVSYSGLAAYFPS